MIAQDFFPGDDLRSIGDFRIFVAKALLDAGLPELVAAGKQVGSELAGNAARHSRSRLPSGVYTGRVEIGAGDVVIEVLDQGALPAELDQAAELADDVLGEELPEDGRGLEICRAFGELFTQITPGGCRCTAVRLPLINTQTPAVLAEDDTPRRKR